MMLVTEAISFLEDVRNTYGEVEVMQVTNTCGNRAIGAMLHMDGGMKYIVRDIHDVAEKQKEEDQKND